MQTTYFHLFAKKRCKFCTKALKLLDSKKLAYVISYMDKAPSALEEVKSGTGWGTVPVVLEIVGTSASFIGGYTELEEYIDVAEKKKDGRGEGTDSLQSDTL
jgi:glutaredoxin